MGSVIITIICSNLCKSGWGKVDPQFKIPPLFNETERIAIPIDTLYHVTHKEQAKVIQPHERQTCYTFKPNPKYGKDNPEESSKQISKSTFQKIEHYERVIRGNLSWWGVDTHSWYNSDGQAFHSAVASLQSKRVFVSPFMSITRESRYGNYGFVVNFKDLLKYYQESRNDITNVDDRTLFLRAGGTLRYCNEICYVVIVCTKHDKELEECYPSLSSYSDIFDHKGLLLPSGLIRPTFFESAETIDFKIKHPIKCVPRMQYTCFEIPAFAFHYPEISTTSSLQCPPTNVKEVEITHSCETYKYKCCKKAHI